MHMYPYAGKAGLPPPRVNGGLYTGKPFSDDAPWRNFPSTPDTSFMTQVQLRSAQPPPGATLQPPPGSGVRPGNNTVDTPMPHFTQYGPGYNVFCIRENHANPAPPPPEPCDIDGLRRYYTLPKTS